jgi:predicted nucleic acid-binding protein
VIILDASALIEWLLQTPAGLRIEKRIYSAHENLCAPHVIDVEVVQVLRRLAREGKISSRRAGEAISDLLDLRLSRYPHFVLLPRIWQHRQNLSAYDAAYVALAEMLGAPLVTCDSRLSTAPGHVANVELF